MRKVLQGLSSRAGSELGVDAAIDYPDRWTTVEVGLSGRPRHRLNLWWTKTGPMKEESAGVPLCSRHNEISIKRTLERYVTARGAEARSGQDGGDAYGGLRRVHWAPERTSASANHTDARVCWTSDGSVHGELNVDTEANTWDFKRAISRYAA